MRILRLISAAILSVAPVSAASATTITDDMWVYSLTYTPAGISAFPFYASADAPAGTVVPQGCTASDYGPPGVIEISCDQNPGIDLLATAYGGNLWLPSLEATIGFNADGLVCLSGFFYCEDTNRITAFDVALGVISLCGDVNGGASAGCLTATPWSVTGFRGDEMHGVSGTWDFGFGGYWTSLMLGLLTYDITGHLVSAPRAVQMPTPVPLPAGLPLLALGLGAFGLMRRRRG